ncbi:MAG: YceD family protein [Thermochromatium sp.]
MSTVLPDSLDPWRAAKIGLSFAGELPLRHFPRLLEVGTPGPCQTSARVVYRLDFRCDADLGSILKGWARVRLGLRCQRCLSDLWLDLEASLALRLVRIEPDAKAFEGDYETLVVTDGRLNPFELIEDGLLLEIPLFPRHPVGECQAPELDRVSVEASQWASNPFAILEHLKQH